MRPLKEYDKESILADEVFVEIFEQEDEILKARMLLSCQDRAKELGVKSKFDTMVKAFTKVAAVTQKQQTNSRSMLENWTNFTGTYDNMKCGSWLAADDGIRTFNKDYANEVIVCYHPILPIERLKNLETGEEQLRLAYKRNHCWREIIVPKDLVSSSNKIVALSKLGVAVTSENAKLLVKYLSDVENLNDDVIPVQKSTTKLGWIGDGFVPYDTDVVFDGDSQFKQVFDAIGASGNANSWLEYVKKLRATNRPEIKFSLAASFASVLVGRLGALPFIFDLWGETEGGKSVSMMLAASIWANPDTGQYIGDFKSTDVQLEVRADMLNNLPMMLDDSSKVNARIRDNFEGFVYDLCSGKGKSRSNKDLGIRRENRWKNAILTNGERPLSSYVSQGGAINRILELECGENIFPDPQGTVEFLRKNYGHAGKRFVKVVKQLGIDAIKDIQEEFQREIFQDDKMQKQSISLSVILAADKIATDYIFCDGEYICLSDARKVLVDKNEVSENERCYQYLLDKISMNSQKFDQDTKVEKWGIIEDGYAIIYVQAFKELCNAGGFSDKSFLSWAHKHGIIQTQKDRLTKLKKMDGKPVRCIFLQLNEFVDEDGFEDANMMEEYEQEELPFR